jgi:hypothetical protein
VHGLTHAAVCLRCHHRPHHTTPTHPLTDTSISIGGAVCGVRPVLRTESLGLLSALAGDDAVSIASGARCAVPCCAVLCRAALRCAVLRQVLFVVACMHGMHVLSS